MKSRIRNELIARQAAEVAKGRVYVDSPDDVPEGYEVQEGQRGGIYYETSGTSEGQSRFGTVDGRGHALSMNRPDQGELDEYVEKVRSTEWWEAGYEGFTKSWEEGENTENEYTTDDGEWDPEREQKHKEWAESLLNEDARVDPDSDEDPVGVVLLGPPGAGKGWWQEQVEEGEYNEDGFGREFTHISSDETKEPIPGYNGANASYVHEEASKIAKEDLFPEAIDRNQNVIVDKVATSPESTKRMMDKMEENGYDMRAVFVDVPPEKSAYNVVQRFGDEGRFTPLDYTIEAREGSYDSFQEITEDIPEDKVGVFDNDVVWGNEPEPVQVGDDLFKAFIKRIARRKGYTLLTTSTEARRFMCGDGEY